MGVKDIESKVTEVTVYQGRAMITRHAEIDLETGTHILVFPDLPESLNRESIQVKGSGEATLGECSFETEYFSEDVNPKMQPLLRKQEKLTDKIAEISLEITAFDKEKAFIDNIAGLVTTPISVTSGTENTEKSNRTLDASTWTDLLGFYHNKNAEIDRLKLASEREIRELQHELEALTSEIENLGYQSEHSRNVIKVGVEKKQNGPVALDLSYMLNGPTWWPVYNLRASSKLAQMVLEYNALVRQGTGEDWDEVDLKLSTAKVSVSGVLPELQPWRLRYYEQPQIHPSKVRSKKSDDNELYGKVMEASASAPMEMSEEIYDEEMVFEEAEVDSSTASVIFTVAGGGNISGDNNDTRVSLFRRELPAVYHYSTVPKLSEFAYLSSELTNKTEYPLLPGKVNVFFDGSFVATSTLPLIMPDEVTEISLGIDEAVKTEYRFIKRFKKPEGLVNKRTSEQFEYQIRLTNNSPKEIDIKVYDQFPISEEKEIVVKGLAPLVKDNQKDITMDDESKLEWKLKIPSGEKREIAVSFIVEYPVARSLSGL